MAIYLVDRNKGKLALELCKEDPEAKICLIQDGVYLDIEELKGKRIVMAIDKEVKRRGLDNLLPSWVERIDYPRLLELIFQEKVYNFI